MEKAAEPRGFLEFYSGIGGMRYSLLRAGIEGEVVEAFDINEVANDVYQHNFGHRPFQGNIQTLTASDLDKYQAHAWLLSPPCQPYTRQGLQKDSADARAFSFIKILKLMTNMLHPPTMIFVENVVGFEVSNTHEQMMEVLLKLGFVTQEYILSPLQFGIPYSRPRYFCLAKRKPLSFLKPSFNNLLVRTPSPLLSRDTMSTDRPKNCDGRQEEEFQSCEPISQFLEPQLTRKNNQNLTRLEGIMSMVDGNIKIDSISTDICSLGDREGISSEIDQIEEIEESETGMSNLDKYSVPPSLIDRWGNAMDIVYPDCKRCCCFTKSYYRYVKGTGSLLATLENTDAKSDERPEASSLKELGLRFFTPREVANLHSFPADFHFPTHISLRQQYALLGNSLSVAVVAPLLQYLFSEPT